MKKEHVSAMPGSCPHINYGTAYWRGSGRASLFNSFACRKLEVRATSDTKTLLSSQSIQALLFCNLFYFQYVSGIKLSALKEFPLKVERG